MIGFGGLISPFFCHTVRVCTIERNDKIGQRTTYGKFCLFLGYFPVDFDWDFIKDLSLCHKKLVCKGFDGGGNRSYCLVQGEILKDWVEMYN